MDSRNYKKLGEYGQWQHLAEQLDPGDLIEINRAGGTFQHWGVTLEIIEDKVIIVNVNGDVLTGFGALIGTRKDRCLADIRVEELSMAVGNDPCRVNNSIDEVFEPFQTGAQVARRGLSQIGQHKYSVWNNNCQHWANWCRNGHLYSPQAEEAEKQLEVLKETSKEEAQRLKEDMTKEMGELMAVSKVKYKELKQKLKKPKDQKSIESTESKESKKKDKRKKEKKKNEKHENVVTIQIDDYDSQVPKSPREKVKSKGLNLDLHPEDQEGFDSHGPVTPDQIRIPDYLAQKLPFLKKFHGEKV